MGRIGTWLLVAAVAVALVASPVVAKEKKSPEDRFKKVDANSDGKVSKEEFTAKAKDAAKAEKAFGRLDKDKNGSLTLEEFTTPAKKKKDK